MVNEPAAEGTAPGAEAAGLAQMLSDNPEFANALDDNMGEEGAGSLMPTNHISAMWSQWRRLLFHQTWHGMMC